ncbi:hypothetical protein Tel_14680 [Candidatus Tenderia electrophaga]|uniref:Multidrug-efflux transporter n=1 Tax=Candidatus Tenderia electrophaga TaxID=1748243 RepID=A0A0S2TGK6_9GAMM|nr:hypothetical protein Tel_14680 [Candidatus Tenderia electrophaga]
MQAQRTPSETLPLLRIAWPLVMASLLSMGISITDVVMSAWLGPLQLAAGAAMSDFYSVVYYLALGVIAALSPIIGQALGAGDRRTVRRATQQAFWVVALLCLPGVLIIGHSAWFLSLLQVKAEIIQAGIPYARMMALYFCFMLLAMVWHYFLSAHKQTAVIFRAMLAILPLNALCNYLFMYGFWGVPALGLAGIGFASVVCATTLFAALTVYVLRHRQYHRYRLDKGLLRFDGTQFAALFRIGLPIGMINLAELGVFLLATVIMGAISVEVLAAHTIAIRMAGVIYALPLGLAQAAAVRVAWSVGAKDAPAVWAAGRSACALALGLGLAYLILLTLFSEAIAGLFLQGQGGMDETLALAQRFLILLALAQPLACLGTVAGGLLRGCKDTRVPMVITLVCYWGLGFATAMVLAFGLGYGGTGIWIGLALGDALVGIMLSLRLNRYRRQLKLPDAGALVLKG